MADHTEHGFDNPAFDGGTLTEESSTDDIDDPQGCAKDQDMSKSRQDDTGQEQKNPLLGSEDETGAAEGVPPPAEPVRRKSSTIEISRLFEHGAKKKSETEGIREGFYTEDSDNPSRYKVDESDYDSHRTTEFPHISHILGSMPAHQLKKRKPSTPSAAMPPSLPDVTEDPGSDSEGEYTVLPAITLQSPKKKQSQPISGSPPGVKFQIGDDHDGMHYEPGKNMGFLSNLGYEEPVLSEGVSAAPATTSPHVKFSLGSARSLDDKPPPFPEPAHHTMEDEEKPKKKKVPTATLR